MKPTIIVGIVVVLLMFALFAVKGVVAVGAWLVLKLIFPFIALFVLLVTGVVALIQKLRNKPLNRVKTGMFVILNISLVLPLLLTMNVVPMAFPANVKEVKPSLAIVSPFKAPAIIAWGGDEFKDNVPHAMWGNERWAYDLVMDAYNTGSTVLEDYGVWGEDVYAPVTGTVVAAYDAEPDIVPNTEGFLSMEGNHVYIEVAETGTFLLLNHLQQNSVVVKIGDVVAVGDLLAKAGNSGSTSEPHLHIHHQREDPRRTWNILLAEGLPLYFKTKEGDKMLERGSILSAQH
ncbi:M23 family metallopeptidase [Listeria riparia]|uniref:Cell wall endopeptidase n=1 Tax=Listeria riparia FSL S10-1204 TaxID=1265816 RepID=W7CSK3_9LIST|nr:M23 family metallopeptidase [Listeria riparia]EUJ42654.1 cell wall endopeptidase [Listeria riparia FSL S10-1204]